MLWRIGESAFQGSSVEDIVLLSGLQVIESSAFEGCDGLRHIRFPEALEKAGSRCFAKSGLEKVTLRPMISENYADIFDECD